MNRFYRLYGQASAPGAEMPPALAALAPRTLRMPAGELVVFTFEEADFPRIVEARRWLREQSMAVTELGDRLHDPEDARTAPLVRLTGGVLADREPLEADVLAETPCAACGLAVPRMRPAPLLRLPHPLGSDLGWLAGPGVWVASSRFLDALRAAGLDSGLATFPVEVQGTRESGLFGLYSTAPLGAPAAPYGFTGERCETCGRHSVRRPEPGGVRVDPGLPRYAFYPTFTLPDGVPDWGWTEPGGETDLFVSRRVHHWLAGPGAGSAGAGSEERGGIDFLAAGVYPDEAEKAFLAPEYQE
jgi:hypothetical protein